MAKPTDLAGFLRDDDDNLTMRLVAWFKDCNSSTFALKVRFKGPNDTSYQRLDQGAPIVGQATPEGVTNVVDQIERLVTEKLGSNPYGTLRITGYNAGKAMSPAVDMQRTLLPAESGGLGEPNVALLKALLHEERTKNQHLQGLITTTLQTQAQTIAALSQSLQGAATVRTASTASSDMAGLAPIIGLGTLFVFMPLIKKTLDLPPNASIADVAARLQALTMGAVEGLHEPPAAPPERRSTVPDVGRPSPPRAALVDSLPELVERDELVERPGDELVERPGDERVEPLSSTLLSAFERAKEDPEGLRAFMRDHPEVIAQLMRL
jgi:hypothetical protein